MGVMLLIKLEEHQAKGEHMKWFAVDRHKALSTACHHPVWPRYATPVPGRDTLGKLGSSNQADYAQLMREAREGRLQYYVNTVKV